LRFWRSGRLWSTHAGSTVVALSGGCHGGRLWSGSPSGPVSPSHPRPPRPVSHARSTLSGVSLVDAPTPAPVSTAPVVDHAHHVPVAPTLLAPAPTVDAPMAPAPAPHSPTLVDHDSRPGGRPTLTLTHVDTLSAHSHTHAHTLRSSRSHRRSHSHFFLNPTMLFLQSIIHPNHSPAIAPRRTGKSTWGAPHAIVVAHDPAKSTRTPTPIYREYDMRDVDSRSDPDGSTTPSHRVSHTSWHTTPRLSTREATPIVDVSLTANRRRSEPDPQCRLLSNIGVGLGLLVWLERGLLQCRWVNMGATV